MFDIASLALKSDSTEVQLRHPVTNELLWNDEAKTEAVSVFVFGSASKEYRDARAAMQNRQLKRGKQKPSVEVLNEEGVNLLVACIDKFANLTDGGKVPTTEADIRSLLNNPHYSWVRDQVDEAISDTANFLAQ